MAHQKKAGKGIILHPQEIDDPRHRGAVKGLCVLHGTPPVASHHRQLGGTTGSHRGGAENPRRLLTVSSQKPTHELRSHDPTFGQRTVMVGAVAGLPIGLAMA